MVSKDSSQFQVRLRRRDVSGWVVMDDDFPGSHGFKEGWNRSLVSTGAYSDGFHDPVGVKRSREEYFATTGLGDLLDHGVRRGRGEALFRVLTQFSVHARPFVRRNSGDQRRSAPT
jgi:hypothetical protein